MKLSPRAGLVKRSILVALLGITVGCRNQTDSPTTAADRAAGLSTSAVATTSTPSSVPDEAALLFEMTQAVRRFAAEQQRRPKDIGEVVGKGYLPAAPSAPAGKRFAINKNLAVVLEPQ